jgi:hypothetical protein
VADRARPPTATSWLRASALAIACGGALAAAAADVASRQGATSPTERPPLPIAPPQLAPSQEAPAPAPEGAESSAARDEAAFTALHKGLDWLAREQARGIDGGWPLDGATQRAPVGIAGLATLALLAGGSTPDRGPHAAAVARGVDYLLARADRDPRSPEYGFLWSPGDRNSDMHGHGYATHALAEAFALSPATPRGRDIARVLPAALRLIERSQGAEGAWMYHPRVTVQHEGSVTIALVQAMRAARNAGFHVDSRVIAAADDYVRRSQTEDGTFAYHLGSNRTTVGLTAAAVATLNATGTYDDPVIRRAVDAIWRELGRRTGPSARRTIEFPHYERFYLAQALWQLSDRSHFDRWFDAELRVLIADQRADGSWPDPVFGDAHATAMNCLTLAIPAALLPSFAR